MIRGFKEDTICALSTSGGVGAISVIRLSGKKAISISNSVFNKDIRKKESHTIHFGLIIDEEKKILDEVTVAIFKNPKSYTGEDLVEITCHASQYIRNKLIQLLIKKGARLAQAGEFTIRAFKNGKIDLSQAESVIDLINSKSQIEHETALNQLRGGFSNELKVLRKELLDFASLVELELDFSEEDVEFANRKKLTSLLKRIEKKLVNLIDSYKLGNVIKNGVPIAIIGPPNVGKSTLLNTLLNEERAIVSEIAGTTRDTIEDELVIQGVRFRFTDTAGLRDTKDKIENIGIKKALEKAKKSQIIIYMIDASLDTKQQLKELKKIKDKNKACVVVNKVDINNTIKNKLKKEYIYISAKNKSGIKELKIRLIQMANLKNLSNHSAVVTNTRHYEELILTLKEIREVISGMKNMIFSDLLSIHIRQALFHLGSITGEVTTDDLLGNIFGKFCIGK